MVGFYRDDDNANKRIRDALQNMTARDTAVDAYTKGDYATAAIWAERAEAAAKDPGERVVAASVLGVSAANLERPEQAEAALVRVLAFGSAAHPVLRSVSALHLGWLLDQRGDVAGARAAFEVVLEVNEPVFAPLAASDLGTLEDQQGQHDRAKELWEYAYSCGSRRSKDYAAHNLGWFWERAGDARKARRYYKVAARSAEPKVSERAIGRLSCLSSRGLLGRGR